MKKRTKTLSTKLPKGAYRLPDVGYVTESHGQVGKKSITIRAVHRDPPDVEKLARAFVQLADQLRKEEQEE